ncbi:cupin domain-containing protein [Nodosilinea sp. LEGE 06152]|uniref:cupin domain-containing protein n=1 Tax=Nodosilinea sp. LEGE 06152 TaxID=2777966 RepID=UPI001880B00E|nr:cupin domain-containing protein [Nodosilinea sp. LEGE 06152]MBE9157041.1 cupin domain-containing protein [Nodosilinea sp. LEGE 06152]
MSTQFSQSNAASVRRSENLDWFDTVPGERMAIRVHSKNVGGAFTILEVRVPPFMGPPLHYHQDREEIFEVLEGRFRFHCEGEEFEVGPGTSVVVPRSSVHGWINLGPGTARMLFTFVPGGIDDFFPLIGQTPPEGWTDLARQHDTWIVGAPLAVQAPFANAAAEPA